MDILQRNFSSHVNQETELVGAIKSDKIFPVWLFLGPAGVGKFLAALKFAKSLLSGRLGEDSSLNINESDEIHKLVDNRIHPDLFVIENENISIDEARNLMAKVRKSPSLSKRRVVIIKNTEYLNKNVCNSLLKILEEPPQGAVFILISSNPGNLPASLLSRTAKLRFSPLSNDEIESVLKERGVLNAKEIANISDGSMDNAIYISENDGVKLYKDIIGSFKEGYEASNKVVARIIDQKLCENFKPLKALIIRSLREYVNSINGIEMNENFPKPTNRVSRTEKILQIIDFMNRAESLQLDKNAIVADVFEQFFEKDVA